ncbi:RNA-directed DNA polymerase, eukaryota, reverse transcriptase zinc-binding domain protein [Tanacetum coccineum]
MITWIMKCVKSTRFSICLNGDMHGFFKRGRGLSQGDLISPYLFTLVMEVFSLIMEKNIEESSGLCKGNKESIKVIKKSLDEFSQVSGLIPNLSKSIIFFGSINERDKIDLLQVLPFKCGKLPIRYLGVPLLAKKLGKDSTYCFCSFLYAAILASVYLLLTAVIHDLEKLFKKFRWNAGDSAKGKARVSWKVVCKPKEQGGLGIKSLKKYVNVEKSDSWGWKTMPTLRDGIRNHVWYEIGNGKNVSIWYDKWCIDGPLSSVITGRDIYDARLDDNARVVNMIRDNQWVCPDGWREKFAILSNLSSTVNLL